MGIVSYVPQSQGKTQYLPANYQEDTAFSLFSFFVVFDNCDPF